MSSSLAAPPTISRATLERLRWANDAHLDHYGGGRLPFACLGGRGMTLRLAELEGPHARRTFEVLDASGAYGTACLGAGHEVVKRAVAEALDESGVVTDEVGSTERMLLLETLLGPGGLLAPAYSSDEYHVSGRNSGSEGMELALRLALESRFDRRNLRPREGLGERHTLLVFEGAWHGWTAGLVPLLNRRHFLLGLPKWSDDADSGFTVSSLPFGQTAALESYFDNHGSQLLAVVVEPVQGDAGIVVPPPGFLRRLADLCRQHDVALIADEVLTFAKTGRLLAMRDEAGTIPADITVIGKSLGMGAVSTSLVIARRRFTLRASGAVSTWDLRPVTCAIVRRGLAHLVQEGLLERSYRLGQTLREQLQRDILQRFPEVYSDVRGIGYLNGIELTEAATGHARALRISLIEHGLYLEVMAGAGRRSGGLRYLFPALRIAPPLIATADDLQRIVERLRDGTIAFLERQQ